MQSYLVYLGKENTVGASRENISKNSPEEKKYTYIFNHEGLNFTQFSG